MFRLRWPTIAGYSALLMLGVLFVFQGTLSAKGPNQTAADKAAADKAAKKKKATKRPAKGSDDGSPSVDGSGGAASGTSVGGGGLVGGVGGNQLGSATGIGGPPGIGGSTASSGSSKSSTQKRSSAGGGKKNDKNSSRLTANHPEIRRVGGIQRRYQNAWLRQKGVAGVATGVDDSGNVEIHVFVTGADNPNLPASVDGVAVVPLLTGSIHPAQGLGPVGVPSQLPPKPPAAIGASTFVDIFASTVKPSPEPCSGSFGSIACRMVGSNQTVYALSCNHVFAGNTFNVFDAKGNLVAGTAFPIGTPVFQPALGDVGCPPALNVANFANTLGTLAAVAPLNGFYVDPFVNFPFNFTVFTTGNLPASSQPLLQVDPSDPVFDANPSRPSVAGPPPYIPGNFNTVDCALVGGAGGVGQGVAATLDTATPVDGYGNPTDQYTPPFIGMAVQKYGRTTRLTKGTVTHLNGVYLNAGVPVAYANITVNTGTANNGQNGTTAVKGALASANFQFVEQVIVQTPGGGNFVLPGDSGALVVDMNNNPVAMVQFQMATGGAVCGDFSLITQALEFQLGNTVTLKVDTSPSLFVTSKDFKLGRSTTDSP